MGFFGIGAPEMVIILVVALIIFGPGKLPEVAGQAGKAVRDFRRMTSELTGEFEKTVNEAGAGDFKASLTGELTGMKSQVDSVSKSVQRDLNKAGTSAQLAVSAAAGTTPKAGKPASPKTAKAAAAKPTANGTGSAAAGSRVATKADPLADVSAMDEDAAETRPVTAPSPNPANGAGTLAGATTATNGKAAETGNGTAHQPSALESSAPSSTSVPSEALARARQRRQSAAYGSRHRG